jgi:hypothetical protein
MGEYILIFIQIYVFIKELYKPANANVATGSSGVPMWKREFPIGYQ